MVACSPLRCWWAIVLGCFLGALSSCLPCQPLLRCRVQACRCMHVAIPGLPQEKYNIHGEGVPGLLLLFKKIA